MKYLDIWLLVAMWISFLGAKLWREKKTPLLVLTILIGIAIGIFEVVEYAGEQSSPQRRITGSMLTLFVWVIISSTVGLLVAWRLARKPRGESP